MGFSFSQALSQLKEGQTVARAGWNGKGMFLFLVDGYEWNPSKAPALVLGLEKLPFICMKTADKKVVPWLASQTDLLAEDWVIVD